MYIVFIWRCVFFRVVDMNILCILVVIDCYVGYLENDEICCFDFFNVFEEICFIVL